VPREGFDMADLASGVFAVSLPQANSQNSLRLRQIRDPHIHGPAFQEVLEVLRAAAGMKMSKS
jgi:hypothetical protein